MKDTSPFLETETAGAGLRTTCCPVRLSLTDGRLVRAELYLPNDPVRPGGVMSVEGTLDTDREFVPARIEGRSTLLRRDAIRIVELEPETPGADDLPEISGSFDVVTLLLDSGETVSGVLRFAAPVDTMRMSDVFNWQARFLTLSVGDHLVLVAKRHVVEAAF